jgi:mitochondrial fission protein ELM1
MGAHQHGLQHLQKVKKSIGKKAITVLSSHEKFEELEQALTEGTLDLAALPSYIKFDEAELAKFGAKLIITTGVAHNVTKEAIVQSLTSWKEDLPANNPLLMVALGGDTTKPFTAQEAIALAATLAARAEEKGATVITTTSRRTSAEATQAFQAELQKHTQATYFFTPHPNSHKPNVYLAMIGLALRDKSNEFYVTADSISMCYEVASFIPRQQLFLIKSGSMEAVHQSSAEILEQNGYANVLGKEPKEHKESKKNEIHLSYSLRPNAAYLIAEKIKELVQAKSQSIFAKQPLFAMSN